MTAAAHFDVAIIGGGTADCAAAVLLRRAGMAVVLIERDRCGAAASGVNFGGVRQQGRHPAELPLAIRAQALWPTLNALLGEDTEFTASGHLKLARSEADLAELDAYAVMARDAGLDLTMIGQNAIRADVPWLSEQVIGASLSPKDGQANPRVVAPAFARLARRLGVDVLEQTSVTAARRTEHGFALLAGTNEITSRLLINCAGMGAAKIASLFGEVTPLQPLMPNMIVTEPLPYIATRSIGVCGGDIYVRQIPRGNVIFGGGHGGGNWRDWRSRPATATTIAAIPKLLDIVPAFCDALIIRSWSGIDGELPDQLPIIGPSATTPGLLHAFGFHGAGFQLGPVIGAILAELTLTGATPSPIAPFSINRFSEPSAAGLEPNRG
jgi:sarcosine oxidase subunit beta